MTQPSVGADRAIRTFEISDEPALRQIMAASQATDAIPGFLVSDIERALIRVVPDPEGTVVALDGGRIVGYCTPHHDDLTVHPDFRRRGHGRALVAAARELVARRGLDDHLQVYVPSHLPGSVAFAEALGFQYRSSLWRFELLPDYPAEVPVFPAGVVTRAWDTARDTDLGAWLDFLHNSFSGHPTRMPWTLPIVSHIHAAPDFDPTTILLATPLEEPDRPIAFTRIEMLSDETGRPLGDINLIGVLPEWRGQGIGRALLQWGVAELRSRGAARIELSVEAANERATRLYRAHGFEPTIEWPHWVLPVRA